MKFDVIIGNPPYQLSDWWAWASAMPLYHKFVNQAMKLNPKFISMIIPSRWFAWWRWLDDFRRQMQDDTRIKFLVDYPKSRECFAWVDIAWWVCYFLWDSSYSWPCEFVSRVQDTETRSKRYLSEFDLIIRDNNAIWIIHKVLAKNEKMMSETVLKVNPFWFRSYERWVQKKFPDCATLISSAGIWYIERSAVQKNQDLVDSFKLCIGYLNPDRAWVNNAKDGKINVTTKTRLLEPGEVVTETYIIPFASLEKSEVENCQSYIKTKFARFMISLTLSSMHIAQWNFSFVPLQDFNKSWTDSELFQKYWFSEEEISLIENTIRSMD